MAPFRRRAVVAADTAMNDLATILEALRNAQKTALAFHPLKRNAGRCLRQLERILLDREVTAAMNRLSTLTASPPLAPAAKGSENEGAKS